MKNEEVYLGYDENNELQEYVKVASGDVLIKKPDWMTEVGLEKWKYTEMQNYL